MYKLSSYISLQKEQIDQAEDCLVIHSRAKTKVYLVNNTIFNFLSKFEFGNSIESIINDYKLLLNLKSETDLNTLENQLNTFFKELKRKGWIVSEDTIEATIAVKTQLEKNNVINEFKIQSVLANKKTTDVYLVTSKNKQFVLKLLNRDKVKDEKTFNRLTEGLIVEYGFLTKFNSIYINKTFGLEYFNNQPFLLLEYVKGESLYRYIKHNTINSKYKIKFVTKILKGFSIIHKANVYHGDIHLSNVLVKRNRHPKIIDFGYSNMVSNTSIQVKNGGVLAFIPPERALRSLEHRFKKVTQFQSEVYQIGLLIYYIYTKTFPFESETWKTLVDEKKIFEIRDYEPFLKKRMPKTIREFIIKALDKTPENRFLNAQDMLNNWLLIQNKR